MEIIIKADPKEIADLVLAIQGQLNPQQVKLTLDDKEFARTVKDSILNGSERGMDKRLKNISTAELVEELKTRIGVKTHIAEPFIDLTVTVNGPAIVLTITD